MNIERRNRIAKAATMIDDAINALTEIRDEEQDAFDNLPEGFQQGENGEKMEGAIECLSEAVDSLEQAASSLEQVE